MSELHDRLHAALKIWVKLLGLKVKRGKLDEAFRTIGAWQAAETVEKLNAALDMDATGVTCAMLLRSLLETSLDASEYTLRNIYYRDKSFMNDIRRAHRILKILAEPVIEEPVLEFRQKMREAVAHYEGTDEALKLVDSRFDLGMLRRDSLRSMSKIKRFQFLRGPAASPKAGYNQWVLQFLNVNSLVEAVSQQPEYGVSLCMIRDKDPVFSYFVFACWNGGTLTLLSDRPTWAHPGQKQMIRRPDRHLEERWNQHHFPYELLEAKFFHRGVDVPRQEGLVRYQSSAVKLKKLNELNPYSFLWLIMMFEHIEKQHFAENLQLTEQCYTAEMVQTAVPVQTSLIVRDGYTPCSLPAVTVADMSSDAIKSQWEHKSTEKHSAYEEIYGPRITDDILNLQNDDKGKLRLLPGLSKESKSLIKRLRRDLAAVSPTDFGTPEELRKNQLWFGRFNQAKAIDHLAEEDYKKHKTPMLKWLGDAARKNLDALLEATVRLELNVDTVDYDFNWEIKQRDAALTPVRRNLLNVEYQPNGSFHTVGVSVWYDYKLVTIEHGDFETSRKHHCCMTGAQATIFAYFRPLHMTDLPAITGVSLEKTPLWLRKFYTTFDVYDGNCILDRLDPMDWVVQNHWKEFPACIRLYLSRTAFNQLRKKHGLPVFKEADFLSLLNEKDPKHPKYVKPRRW